MNTPISTTSFSISRRQNFFTGGLRTVVILCAALLFTACDKKPATAAEAVSPKPSAKEPQPVAAAQPVVVTAADPSTDDRRVAAIFTANHADKSLDEKLPALEDYISSRITEKGFSVISREVVTGALSSLLKDSKQTGIEQMLANNASMLRLSQMLGAKYIIMVSISSYKPNNTITEAYDVKTVTVINNLKVTYKVLEGVQGGTLAGDTFTVSHTNRYTANIRTENTGIIDDLLDAASVKIAESIGTKVIKSVAPSTLAEFSVACGMQDLAQLPLGVPDIRLTENNTVVVEKGQLQVQALNVMVELDGAGIGSTPAKFKVPAGLHTLRLRRDGFKDYEGTITVFQGQTFNIALQMTDAGYQRWKDNTAFLNSIETGKKLTDAEAEKIRGEAQKFRQSGNLVNVKVDTKEGVKVYKSIW